MADNTVPTAEANGAANPVARLRQVEEKWRAQADSRIGDRGDAVVREICDEMYDALTLSSADVERVALAMHTVYHPGCNEPVAENYTLARIALRALGFEVQDG